MAPPEFVRRTARLCPRKSSDANQRYASLKPDRVRQTHGYSESGPETKPKTAAQDHECSGHSRRRDCDRSPAGWGAVVSHGRTWPCATGVASAVRTASAIGLQANQSGNALTSAGVPSSRIFCRCTPLAAPAMLQRQYQPLNGLSSGLGRQPPSRGHSTAVSARRTPPAAGRTRSRPPSANDSCRHRRW